MRMDRSSGSYFFTRKLSRASAEWTELDEASTDRYSTVADGVHIPGNEASDE